MTKDRTAAFKAAAGKYESEKSESRVLISFKSYDEEIEDVASRIETAREKVKLVVKKQSDLLTHPSLDEGLEKKQLEDLMDEVNRLLAGIRTQLKTMDQTNKAYCRRKEATPPQITIRRTQYNQLIHRFSDVVETYKTSQVNYTEKCKAQIKRKLEIMGRNVTDEEVEGMLEMGQAEIFIQCVIAEGNASKQMLSDVKERHAHIMELEKGIRQLNEMFLDMALIVEEQGAMVDRIEYNVGEAVTIVSGAKDELDRARKHKQSARKRKICIIIIVLTILLVVALIITVTQIA